MAESQLPQKVQKDPILAFLESKKDVLMGAMPRTSAGITFESILQGVWLTLDKNPKLRECHPRTIFASILYILRLGLDPSGQTGEAYLIPYKQACTPQLGAYGKLRLAQRYGGVGIPAVDVVYENDECDWDNARNWLKHKQAFGENRGKPLFIYFRAWVKGGVDPASGLADVQELMSWSDFEKIRENSRAKNFGKLSPAYTNWPDEMAKRSAISRGVKRIDKSPDLLGLIATASSEYEQTAKVRRREVVIDEAGTVIGEDFSPLPIGEDLGDPNAPTSEVVQTAERRPEPSTGPSAEPQRSDVAGSTPAPAPVIDVDPDTGEPVPSQEELDAQRAADEERAAKAAARAKETPPKRGAQGKLV